VPTGRGLQVVKYHHHKASILCGLAALTDERFLGIHDRPLIRVFLLAELCLRNTTVRGNAMAQPHIAAND
jgi:hypothetical protein